MKFQSRVVTRKVVVITIVIVALLVVIRPATAQGGECQVCDNDHCVKLDSGGSLVSWSLPAASSSYIVKITVKAGSDSQDGGSCHTFTATNPADSCYLATGFGTKTGTVQKIGAGPACKDISHVLFYWWADHLGTPTPSPTPPPSPTATVPPPTSTPGDPTATPDPDVTPTPTIPIPTPTSTLVPSPTPPPPATPTPPPPRKSGSIRGFMLCVDAGGSHHLSGYKLFIKTNNIGTLGGFGWPPTGIVGQWPTMPRVGTTVLDAGPGQCCRVGDDYPADPTCYDWREQNKFGVDDVGQGGILCVEKCPDSSTTFQLPESGGDYFNWFMGLVARLLNF